MRRLAAIWFLFLLSSGCECRNHGVRRDVALTANVQGRLADGGAFDNSDPGLKSSYMGGGSAVFGTPAPSYTHPRIAFPQDMTVEMPFLTRLATGEAHLVDLNLTVRQVSDGPSQIDLDDTRAALDGWSGVQGQVSVTTLAQDCSHGGDDCLIQLHATIELSATNAGGDTIRVTGATLDQEDTYFDEPTMCAQVGE
jgi:hypothetical protein